MPPSSDASTLDDSNQEHDERDDQEDVNESTQGYELTSPRPTGRAG